MSKKWKYLIRRNYGIDDAKVRVIDNHISQEDFSFLNKQFGEIERFIDHITANNIHRLQETEPIQKINDIEAQDELEHN